MHVSTGIVMYHDVETYHDVVLLVYSVCIDVSEAFGRFKRDVERSREETPPAPATLLPCYPAALLPCRGEETPPAPAASLFSRDTADLRVTAA